MSETKKCKYCQTEIDKKAKICPNCRKKQGGKGKFIILGVIVFFILVAVFSTNNNNSKPASSDAQNKSGQTADKASKEDKAIALGSEGQSDNLSLKVNKIAAKKEIKEGDFISYKPDSGKYAIVNITIKNTGKEAISLTNGYFKLITADEAEYTPTILIGLDNKYISFETINPGLDVTGNLVFEVPNDLTVADATLRFSGTGLFSSATDFSLK